MDFVIDFLIDFLMDFVGGFLFDDIVFVVKAGSPDELIPKRQRVLEKQAQVLHRVVCM